MCRAREAAKSKRSGASSDTDALAGLIAAQPFAAGLGDDALERLIDTASRRRVAEGQFLFHQQATAARFFVVIDGTLKLYRISTAGSEKVIGRVGTGDSFAEGIVFMDCPRYPVHAQAIEASHVIGLSREVYREQLMASPETCLAVMGKLTGRISRLLDEIECLTLRGGRDRVIRFLLGLVPEDGVAGNDATITLPARKNTIAAQLSIRPETLSRILAGLNRDGLIQRTAEPHRLHIPDPAVLRREFNDSTGDHRF